MCPPNHAQSIGIPLVGSPHPAAQHPQARFWHVNSETAQHGQCRSALVRCVAIETKQNTPPFIPQIRLYQNWLRDARGLQFDSYDALWRWSTTELDAFWQSVWDYFQLESPTPHTAVLAKNTMPGAQWFPGAQVNYARQALRHVDAAHAAGLPAIISRNEKGHHRELSWPELRRQVASLALHLKAQGVQPGDRVAIARPGYVAYRNTLKALHMEPVEIYCGPDVRFQLTAEALRGLDPAPAGVIIASPANPTGTIIPEAELAAIAEVCRTRNIAIVSDEIYHGLSYVGPTPSMLQFAPDAMVINSFSKYWSMAGWRLGWLLVPETLIDTARAYIGNMFLTPPSLSQHAGLVAMDAIDELEGHIQTYARNRDLMLAALPALGLKKIAPPDGAFYIWADIGHLTDDSVAFCEQLLRDTGVATAPGVDFDPVDGHRFIRISFAVSTPEVETALARLTPWFAARTPL